MTNVFDYLTWRGDLTFEQDAFNNVDSLILCRMAYLPFDEFLSSDLDAESITIPQVCRQRLAHIDDRGENARKISEDDKTFMTLLTKSERFNAVHMCGYINEINKVQELQFSVTVFLFNGTAYVGFRGTDSTIVGWKEDFNMCFEDVIPAQEKALHYLNMAGKKIDGQFYVGGHSKGGNLALFASSFCEKSIQDRILSVYNLDGPGFDDEIIQKDGYQRITKRIKTFLPQSSIIGIALEQNHSFLVIHSSESNGLLQHHLYSWEVARNHFVEESGLTKSSQLVDRTLRDWLASLSKEEREAIIDGIFAIVSTSGAEHASDLLLPNNAALMIKEITQMDELTQELLKKAFRLFRVSIKKNLPGYFSKSV